jgi:predicted MPP superfamily phosphohydrolase
VLTSGLTAEERAQLLEKLDAVDRDSVAYPSVAIDDEGEEEEELQKTIGEAVAAARMEEAQRQESKWLQERERLMQEAEEAARSRIENDLKVQERRLAMAEQWKKDLNAEAGVVVNLSADHHPVLGQVVADFGYKKIYQVSANTLKSIPVWKKQRLYRHERAKVIATDKLKTLHLGMPGILVLHEVRFIWQYSTTYELMLSYT